MNRSFALTGQVAAPASSNSDGITGLGLQWLTCGLGLLAALMLEVASRHASLDVPEIASSMAIQTGLVLTAFALLRRQARRGQPVPLILIPLLLSLAILPFLVEFISRHLFGLGWTLELTLLAILRNVVLGLCAASAWPTVQRLAAAFSLLLAMLSVSLGQDRVLLILLGIYAVAGVWWLTANHWDRVRNHIAAESEQSLPRRWFVLLPAAVALLVLALFGEGRNAATTALRGFMPTSGGTLWEDEFASGGVNDGQSLVAGQQEASSFGPVETDLFLDSKETSLYDAFNDQYEEPVRRNPSERSIPLPSSLVKDTHQRMAQAKKAHREFSMVRQPPHQHRRPKDVDSDALFYVSGRTPLHLRLEEYDLFDGLDWYPSAKPLNGSGLQMIKRDGRPWLQLDSNSTHEDLFAGTESHEIKTVALQGSHLPLPLHSTELLIDRVDRPDLFAWARDSILRLQRDSIPSLLVIHCRSRVGDPKAMAELDPMSFLKTTQNQAHTTNPTDFSTRQIAQLAARWTEGLPRGWPQIDAIISRLRSEYVHDRGHVATSNSVNPTAQFLLRERRGPDFLFASAAAVMLRSLDYPTRLVSGFYAAPQNYDATTGHTPVHARDVHFWCEVYVGAGTWLPLEPTPGYEILAPRLSLLERAGLIIKTCLAWAGQHWAQLLSTVVVLLAGWKSGLWRELRDRLLDLFWGLRWQMSRYRSVRVRDHLRATRQLILRRCRLAGWQRMPGESDHRFLRRAITASEPQGIIVSRGDTDPNEAGPVDTWLQLLDWARFAPNDMALMSAGPGASGLLREGSPDRAESENEHSFVAECCRRVVSCLSISVFRDSASADDRRSPQPGAGSSVLDQPFVETRNQADRSNDSKSPVRGVLSAG